MGVDLFGPSPARVSPLRLVSVHTVDTWRHVGDRWSAVNAIDVLHRHAPQLDRCLQLHDGVQGDGSVCDIQTRATDSFVRMEQSRNVSSCAAVPSRTRRTCIRSDGSAFILDEVTAVAMAAFVTSYSVEFHRSTRYSRVDGESATVATSFGLPGRGTAMWLCDVVIDVWCDLAARLSNLDSGSAKGRSI